MKKKILIIRSVSFQQLDKNLTAIVQRFPLEEYELHLLTHAHGLERAKSYRAITEIIEYDSRKNFTFFHVPRNLKNNHTQYDAIVIPVTNTSGVGFLNVQALALRIPSQSIYMCNLVSEMPEISRLGIWTQIVKAGLFSALAAVLAIPLSLFAFPVLLAALKNKER
jgi:hypothetical protein